MDSIVLSNTYHVLITQMLGLKREEKCFFVIQISLNKFIEKTAIWTIFCFWASPLNWNLLCNAHNLVFPEKYLQNKDFALLTQLFQPFLGALKIVSAYFIMTSSVFACLKSDLEGPTVK